MDGGGIRSTADDATLVAASQIAGDKSGGRRTRQTSSPLLISLQKSLLDEAEKRSSRMIRIWGLISPVESTRSNLAESASASAAGKYLTNGRAGGEEGDRRGGDSMAPLSAFITASIVDRRPQTQTRNLGQKDLTAKAPPGPELNLTPVASRSALHSNNSQLPFLPVGHRLLPPPPRGFSEGGRISSR